MKRPACIPVLMLVMAAAVFAQEPPSSNTPQVFRSTSQIVPLNVTVTDPKSQFVHGLTASDFAVFEDGVQQEVKFFHVKDVPLDLIVLLDTSSSMSDKMTIVHEAAIGFLKTLREGDRGAVVTFADRVNVAQELTTDRVALEEAVKGTNATGATALYNALYIALKQFGRGAQQEGEVRRQAIAVLSDGEDTSSLVTFEDVLAVARKSGVSVYSIGIQGRHPPSALAANLRGRTSSDAEYSMRRLTQETGGQAFAAAQISELKGFYAAIAQELSSQYSIAYAPPDSKADGRYRRIVVRVAGRPELRLRTRMGYSVEPTRPSAVPVQGQR